MKEKTDAKNAEGNQPINQQPHTENGVKANATLARGRRGGTERSTRTRRGWAEQEEKG